ncbi:sensor histidine kinase [Alteromonas lipolytica]|uniref:histidine kinase n=1 Tax=Alteromonas lipolytica TaxID=1856405 RepID=A0A1E8FI99_9ALTE|nr:ATP-binding protein [Alteromonas lipolytica]OFI35203.1 hypothetical protein BFC17_16820 [Alteromonas lipolytica]GGF57591.1 hypothetical protein GCM10011338_07300 [Alteromonas lipolytica]
MIKSNIEYEKEFAECESENLRATGAVQPGFDVLIFKDGKLIASDTGSSSPLIESAPAILSAPGAEILGSGHQIVEVEQQGKWLRHEQNGYVICERSAEQHSFAAFEPEEFKDIASKEMANIWKLSDRICHLLSEKTKAERVMVYQFHEDWSGEVIAERVLGHYESFLGLRYPPTDIPKIARSLYLELKSRHLFSLNKAVDIVACDNDDITTVDLSQCVSRSISPFHIEYLKNMGTGSTVSCAIILDGKLWGLISLHFARSRAACIDEYVYFQKLVHFINPIFADVIEREKEILAKQSVKAVDRLMTNLRDDLEPFNTLLLSETALHKIVGAQGITMVIDEEIVSIGIVPGLSEIREMVSRIKAKYSPGFYFWDKSPFDFPISHGLAGMAMYCLSVKPFSCFFVFRKMLNQTICWGGDPRHFAQKEKETLRYSPRQSFKRWVENVEGQSVPWSEVHQKAFISSFANIRQDLEVDETELAILLRNGMRRAIKKREQLRSVATNLIDSITTGIAIGIEQGTSAESEIVAINNVTAEAFNVSHTDLIGITLTEFASLLGIEHIQSHSSDSLTIKTASSGVRNVELKQALLFDYCHFVSEEPDRVRLIMYEFLDITEATRIQNSLVAARERAITENKLRSEMMAKLMHELKTPLNGLLGLSDILRRKYVSNEDKKTFSMIESLHQTASLMKEVVDYTLKTSALVDTVDVQNFRVIPLQSLISEIILLIQPLADNKQISFDVQCETVSVYAEPRGVRQVLINLLENAIKYNDIGGNVTVTVVQKLYGTVRIEVKDTGAGMTQEQLAKCTQPYQRFSNQDGSGLGLSIAESLVRNMGGQFEISSLQGKGTTVTINLNMQDAHEH